MTNIKSNSQSSAVKVGKEEVVAGSSETIKRKHDLFKDPALAKSLEEDPVASFILSNWKNLFVVVLALIAFFYLRTQIQSTTDVRVAESSQTFTKARASVVELIEDKQKKDINEKPSADKTDADKPESTAAKQDSTQLLRAAKDSLNALKSGPEPYAELAPIYEYLLNNAESVAQNSVNPTEARVAWQDAKVPSKRLILELQELAVARKLLDSDNTRSDGILRLMELGKNGSYLRSPAVLTLLRVVASAEDISSAVTIAQDVVSLYPENSDKIQAELKRLM